MRHTSPRPSRLEMLDPRAPAARRTHAAGAGRRRRARLHGGQDALHLVQPRLQRLLVLQQPPRLARLPGGAPQSAHRPQGAALRMSHVPRPRRSARPAAAAALPRAPAGGSRAARAISSRAAARLHARPHQSNRTQAGSPGAQAQHKPWADAASDDEKPCIREGPVAHSAPRVRSHPGPHTAVPALPGTHAPMHGCQGGLPAPPRAGAAARAARACRASGSAARRPRRGSARTVTAPPARARRPAA